MEFLTDARHGWQKSARRTDVVGLGNKNKKEIAYGVVISADDACALHHESLGAKRIYEKLDQRGVVFGICAHNNNASISKYIQCSCKEKKRLEAFCSTKTSTSEDVGLSPTPRINPLVNQAGPSG